jgi:ribonuclease HI
MTQRNARKFYAVIRGRQPGIYREWTGPRGAEVQVRGFPGALFRGYPTRAEAEQALADGALRAARAAGRQMPPPVRCAASKTGDPQRNERLADASDAIQLFTDGGCRFNPGPGGYGVVILAGAARRELSGGFRLTTNNRMELMACIVALENIASGCRARLHSDSRYVVDALAKGWARSWQARGWRRRNGEAALNPDLWQRLLALCAERQVEFVWVRGHAGHAENERCDRLAVVAAAGADLPPDRAYEAQAGSAAGGG